MAITKFYKPWITKHKYIYSKEAWTLYNCLTYTIALNTKEKAFKWTNYQSHVPNAPINKSSGKKKKWKILACAYFHQICVQHQTLSFSFKDNCLPFTISLRTVHRRKDTQSIKVISQLHQSIKVQKYGQYYHTCIAIKYESGTNLSHFLRIQASYIIFQESMAVMKFCKPQTTKHKYIYPKVKTQSHN